VKLKIVDRPDVTVVGLQIRTTPMSPDIPALWPRFVARIPEIAHTTEARVSYGVMRPVDGGVSQLDYLAGVAVSAPEPIPAGMTSLVLPAGRYAVFSYPLSGLGAGFSEIFERLLPQSDFVQRPGPQFERYGEAFHPDEPESPVEIYLPVAPKG
jgi:AraC family transcriptional regulator